MLLNKAEKLLMNNPIRASIQRHYEARQLLAMGGKVDGGHVLEIGCGRGIGTEIILEQFGARSVDAFDLDADMIRRARARLARFGDRVQLWTGDATAVRADDETYDAVFDFGIIHHIPDWRAAVREVQRVLKPGGHFFADEIFDRFILNPVVRSVLEHPLEDRFDHDGFVAALTDAGFELTASRDHHGHFGFFVAQKSDSR